MSENRFVLQGATILIISPEYWGQNYVSKHHYAIELSKQNKVFYLNPPSDTSTFVTKQVKNNLQVINCPSMLRGVGRMPGIVLKHYLRKYIKPLLQITDKINIVWSFDPYRFQNLKCFDAEINIYHSVDVHRTLLELKTARTADIIFGTSSLILNKFENIDVNSYKINHGLDPIFLEDVGCSEEESVVGKKLKVGYLGNLLYKYLDRDIFKRIIQQNNDLEFHLIGPYESSNLGQFSIDENFIYFLFNADNVILYGSVPKQRIPKLLSKMDLFLLCYQGDQFPAEMANPHKMLEYLSFGKVVVCSYTDEYVFLDDLIVMSKRNADLPALFTETIVNLDAHNAQIKRESRTSIAAKNLYANQINRIDKLLATIDKN